MTCLAHTEDTTLSHLVSQLTGSSEEAVVRDPDRLPDRARAPDVATCTILCPGRWILSDPLGTRKDSSARTHHSETEARNSRSGVEWMPHGLQKMKFSAVSTSLLTSKAAFFSIFRDLQNGTRDCQKLSKIL